MSKNNQILFFSSITKEIEQQSLKDCFDDPCFVNSHKNIRIIVAPFWLEDYSYTELSIYSWAYHVRIENHNDIPIYILHKQLNLIKENGLQEIIANNSFSAQPIMLEAKTICQYSTSISLDTASNFIHGNYSISTDQHGIFDLSIPSFNLDIPDTNFSLH